MIKTTFEDLLRYAIKRSQCDRFVKEHFKHSAELEENYILQNDIQALNEQLHRDQLDVEKRELMNFFSIFLYSDIKNDSFSNRFKERLISFLHIDIKEERHFESCMIIYDPYNYLYYF
jgi:hypothetical protein